MERWDCDAFCRDEGFAYASACGWDASLGGDACKCEDDACTSGLDLCLGSDFLETCGASGPVTVDCWDVCRDAGYDLVAGSCGACHSMQLVMAQRRSAQRWDELIEWMVATQGMPPPAAAERQTIVSYLARNYGEDAR